MSVRPRAKTRNKPFRVMLALLAAASFAFGLASCAESGERTPTDGDDRPVVLTTFTVLADMAQTVAGEHLRVESITKPGAEIHSYEPSPGDLRRAAHADLILDNGLGLEAWFARFVAELDAPHIVVSDGVEVIGIGEGAAEGLPNPHAWMSPLNAIIYVNNMADAFAELDPEHAEDFRANADAYERELRTIYELLVERVQTIPERERTLVTCEGAFSYLARDAGLKEQYIWAVNAEQEATPRQVRSVIDYVWEYNTPAVFCESTVSDAAMQQVVNETDAVFGGILYVDSLSLPGGPVPTYLDLITHDIETITAGLTGESR